MTLSHRQRILTAIGTVTGACAIAVPAALALSHNPTFGQRIPVHAPSSAHVVTFDDHGGVIELVHGRRHHHEVSHPKSRHHDEPSTVPMLSSSEPDPGDDRSGSEPGDDHGGNSGSGRDGSGDVGGSGSGRNDSTGSGRGGSDDGGSHHSGGDDHGDGGHGDDN